MTEPFRSAGLIYGPELHHLDHLAPLCCFMNIPLIVTEQKIAALAERFYPGIQIILCDYLAVAEQLVSHFDIVFYSMPRDLFDEVFFFAQKLIQKRVHAIWCPHGNSDKGNSIFYMEALRKEEAALVYGKQMIDFLQRKGVYDQLKGHVVTGNYRHQFYLDHKAFYDPIVEREVLRKLPKAEKTLLYAPTWQDYEKSSSFFDAAQPLVEKLPAKHNLIVKLHPNLILQEEFKVEELIEKYEDLNNVLFLTEFPAVYPLLNIVDVYIGDMSSIGYDFLALDRPMFFLNQNSRDPKADSGLYLFRCGVEVSPEQYGDIHGVIDRYFQFELRNFSEIRKEVFAYAFGHPKSLESLKTEILHLYSSFPEKGINFY
ncbi:MAG: CDP-glycerol glycerophosphotransferase family protein [Verrucomicrobia bacterium]|nr:CDP-glycerol glycerophosphotransferase family protein [Verrucomicrobiota bacterium]